MSQALAVGYILLFALISTLIVELLIRIIYGAQIVLFPRNHAAVQYGEYTIRRTIPNIEFWHQSKAGRWLFKINSNGFRDTVDYTYEKTDGVYRILVLGDSMAAGFEVAQSETFCEKLKDSLRRRNVHAEVLNTGVSGFGTAEELVFLENEGLKYDPDMVVVAFYLNDYLDNLRSSLYRLKDGEIIPNSKVYAPGVGAIAVTHRILGLKWLSENSYLYSLALNGIWNFAKRKSQKAAGLEFAVPVGEVNAIQVEFAIALLDRIATQCRTRGVSSTLVDIPARVGASGFKSSFKRDLLARAKRAFTFVIESKTFLADRNPRELLHVPFGQNHISAFTHQRVADALAEVVLEDIAGRGRKSVRSEDRKRLSRDQLQPTKPHRQPDSSTPATAKADAEHAASNLRFVR